MNYRVFGSGHPVIFLHGFLESIKMWEFLDASQLPFQSILIDLPGHGDSELDAPESDPNLEYFAYAIENLLTELSIKEFHVVGHSMGGYVALILKKNNPFCKKVILLNSNFWEDDETKKKDRLRVAEIVYKSKDLFINEAIPGLFYQLKRNEKVVKDLVHDAKKMSCLAIAYSTLAMRNRENNSQLLIDSPEDFLIIQGENDPIISIAKMNQELVDMRVQLKTIKNSGHMSYVEQESITKESILNFLK